jgi:hypothetical protein
LQDVGPAVSVELGIGFHNRWREECRKLPESKWPVNGGHKALDIWNALEDKPPMVNITDQVQQGDLVIFHTMIPHKFSQMKDGIRRDTYVSYDWYLDGQFQGNNSTERYVGISFFLLTDQNIGILYN